MEALVHFFRQNGKGDKLRETWWECRRGEEATGGTPGKASQGGWSGDWQVGYTKVAWILPVLCTVEGKLMTGTPEVSVSQLINEEI